MQTGSNVVVGSMIGKNYDDELMSRKLLSQTRRQARGEDGDGSNSTPGTSSTAVELISTN
jgi:hypothetical protein